MDASWSAARRWGHEAADHARLDGRARATPVPVTLLRAGLRHLTRHSWQAGLSIVGIAVGVAVVVSIDLANESARRAFELSTPASWGSTRARRSTSRSAGSTGPRGSRASSRRETRRVAAPSKG